MAGGGGRTELFFGLCGVGVIFGILGSIMRMGHIDCGTIPIPARGVTQAVYSAPALIMLMGRCELTSPIEYPIRHHEIRIKDGPCTFEHMERTFEHMERLYPPPECKRGEERKMMMWGRTSATYTRNAEDMAWVPWNVTARSLCCPVEAKGLRDADATGESEDGVTYDASTQTGDGHCGS